MVRRYNFKKIDEGILKVLDLEGKYVPYEDYMKLQTEYNKLLKDAVEINKRLKG